MSKGITKLLIVHLKETSIVKKGGGRGIFLEKLNAKFTRKKKDNNHCLLYCLLACFSQANINLCRLTRLGLKAGMCWSSGRQGGVSEHEPPLHLCCPVESAWDHSLHMQADAQEQIQA